MDLDMFTHASTQDNLRVLESRGVDIVDPGTGPWPAAWSAKDAWRNLRTSPTTSKPIFKIPPWSGKQVLITAGPTHEPLDAVRFLGNRSSGKMGFALAAAFADQGALVTLVAGPVSCPPLSVSTDASTCPRLWT